MVEPKTLRQKLTKIIQRLQAGSPTLWPVHVRFDKPFKKLKCWGVCNFRKKPTPHFEIDLAWDAPWVTILDTLMHEWAHAVSWTAVPKKGSGFSDHSALWGVSFAHVYRCIHCERG